MTGLTFLLSMAFASDDCSLWEKQNTPTDCTSDNDYNASASFPASGTLDLHWAPECADGSSTCPPEEVVRCIDGTRPAYYAELNPASDDWVIYLQGGGACGDAYTYDPSTGTYTLDQAAWASCGTMYGDPSETGEMSNESIRDAIVGKGILADDTTTNHFASANRVKIRKCSYDRFMGVTTHEGLGTGDKVLYFHGQQIVRAVLSDLAVNLPTDERLEDGARVLFAGNSGGSGGLLFTVDGYTDFLQSDLGLQDVETAVLLDGRVKPSLENEAAFDPTQPAGTDLYDHITSGSNDLFFDFHPTTYRLISGDRGPTRAVIDTWVGTTPPTLDASCVAEHGTYNWRCYDEGHLMANHIDTRMFLSHSLQDGNHKKNTVPFFEGHGLYGEHHWDDMCTINDPPGIRAYTLDGYCVEDTNGDGVFDDDDGRCNCIDAYKQRAKDMAYALHGPNGPAGLGMWTVDHTQHVQVLKNNYWGLTGNGLCNSVTGSLTTFNDAAWDWFDGGSTHWHSELSAVIHNTWDQPSCP